IRCTIYCTLNSDSHTPRTLPSFPTRRSSDLGNREYPCRSRGRGRQTGDGQNDYDSAHGNCPPDGTHDTIRSGPRLIARRSTSVGDRKSTRLNSSHVKISYAVFCLKKKKKKKV